MVLKKTLENPLDSKEIQLVHPKGNQSWIFIGRADAEAEAPIFWPPYEKNWLIWKDPDAWKDWRQEKKGMTKDEMIGWPHWLDGHEFEQALAVDDVQGSLACCSPWNHKELDMTKWLIWTELNFSSWGCWLLRLCIISWCYLFLLIKKYTYLCNYIIFIYSVSKISPLQVM